MQEYEILIFLREYSKGKSLCEKMTKVRVYVIMRLKSE